MGTSMDGSLVMKIYTPEERAGQDAKSRNLVLCPYDSGTVEMKRYIDRLLELTSGEGE